MRATTSDLAAARVHARLTAEPLSTAAGTAFVGDASAGGTVLFAGTVRDHSEGRDVAGLEYEAYPERAEAQLADLAARVVDGWPDVRGVWLEHRTGALAIGEPSVVVAVSAPHRVQAFEAARWAIDTLKAEVAIWKREHWVDGSAHWPGSD